MADAAWEVVEQDEPPEVHVRPLEDAVEHVHKSPVPGTDFTLSVVDGELVMDVVTNFGIGDDGAYYESDPNDVDTDERAIFNPRTTERAPVI